MQRNRADFGPGSAISCCISSRFDDLAFFVVNVTSFVVAGEMTGLRLPLGTSTSTFDPCDLLASLPRKATPAGGTCVPR
jgi:hypothetical protein